MPDYTSALNLNLVRESLVLMVGDTLPTIALQEYTTLARLPKRTATQKQIKDNVNAGGRNAQRRAVTADRLRTGAADNVVPFTLPIGDFASTSVIQVLKTDAVQAANTGPGALADLFGYQVQGALREIMRDLNALVYSGVGNAATAGVIGLDQVVTGVGYAGITSPLWASLDVESVLDIDSFMNFERQIAESEARCTAIYTTPAIVQKYKKLFSDNRQFSPVSGANNADLGVSAVSYNGRPIIADNQCPANKLFWLDESYVEFHTFDTGTSTNVEGLNIDIQPIPTQNSYLLEFEVGVIPQLAVKNRKAVNRMVEDVTP